MTEREEKMIKGIYGEDITTREFSDSQNIFDYVEVINDMNEVYLYCLSSEEEIFYPDYDKEGNYEGLIEK